jgi:tetratricopeptide (TPR) repeat protein
MQEDTAGKQNLISCYDSFGREIRIPKEQWAENILPGILENAKDDPNRLYSVILQACQDGFPSLVVGHARLLAKTDPVPERGTVIFGIALMDCGKFDEAENVFLDYLRKHGPAGHVLTNLAKVYSHQNRTDLSDKCLWNSLETDPNQENALGWYVAGRKERFAENEIDIFRKVARIPGSWLAKSWMAIVLAKNGNVDEALSACKTIIGECPDPLPESVFGAVSAVFGISGSHKECLDLLIPKFDPSVHGIEPGGNLIRCAISAGDFKCAKEILGKLYSLGIPELKSILDAWSNEIREKSGEMRVSEAPRDETVRHLFVNGPVWLSENGFFGKLLPEKKSTACRVAVTGSTVLFGENQSVEPEQAASAGRISRMIPSFVTNEIYMRTEASVTHFVPMVGNRGFGLHNQIIGINRLCAIADGFDLVVYIGLDYTGKVPLVRVGVIDVKGAKSLAKFCYQFEEDIGETALTATKEIIEFVAGKGYARNVCPPDFHKIPIENTLGDFMLRNDQVLALMSALQSGNAGMIQGEREIFDGLLSLALEERCNPTVRMLVFTGYTCSAMIFPSTWEDYRAKFLRIEEDYPVGGIVGELIGKAIRTK